MSRFFRPAGDSDSDTEESEEEELMSSDEEAPAGKTAASKPIGMAKFLKGAASSSSSESESEEESDEDESDREQTQKKNRFLVGADASDESDEDERRIVKSATEKRQEEMEAVGRNIDNATKINDWVAISNGG